MNGSVKPDRVTALVRLVGRRDRFECPFRAALMSAQGRSETVEDQAVLGHLRPFMPQKTRVGDDRSQSTTDVARRRNRNEKLYKAGARRSVTLAAQNADRRAAVFRKRIGAIDPKRSLCISRERPSVISRVAH